MVFYTVPWFPDLKGEMPADSVDLIHHLAALSIRLGFTLADDFLVIARQTVFFTLGFNLADEVIMWHVELAIMLRLIGACTESGDSVTDAIGQKDMVH